MTGRARLPVAERDVFDAAGREAYDRLVVGLNTRPGYPRASRVDGIYGILAHNPELAARVGAVGDEILGAGGVDEVDKEITCLAVARATNCQLEWTLHEPRSRRAGVRQAAIDAIRDRRLDALEDRERLFVEFSWGVLRDHVPEPTWAAMHALMGDRGIVTVTVQVAFVALICHCMDTFAMVPPPGADPLLPVADG